MPARVTVYNRIAISKHILTSYPNGIVTTYEYNEINALVKQVTKNKSGTVIASFEYEIGKNGERTKVTELGRTVEYEYDELNRLTKEKVTRGTDVSETIYTYDANSNRLSMTKDGKLTTYAYNALNQITRAGDINYTWDNAGNLVSQTTTTGVLVASYTYDSQNRMISATVSTSGSNLIETYEYDYLGNRTAKTSGGVKTEYTTDLSTGYSQILKATTGSKAVYYTRGFELISRQESSAASYYIYDGGLSVRAMTNEAGTVTDTLVFDAFGNEIVKTGSTDNAYGFQGEEKDDTGLYYLRARYMDPTTGTFTSMDTYGGSLSDPMSLHKYMFANSNPITYCDPSGHFSLMEMDASMAIENILNAGYMSGYLYILDASITDPNLEHHNFSGYLCAIGFGMLFAALNMALSATVAGLLVLAIIDTLLGVAGTIKGVIDMLNGHPIYGGIEIVSSVLLVWFGWRNYAGARSAAKGADTQGPKNSKPNPVDNNNNNGDSGEVDFYITPEGDAIPKEKYHSMNNREARQWYLDQEEKIPDVIDPNASLDQQARQAFNQRNKIRTTARELMSDRDAAESLYKTDPNKTWEQMIDRAIEKGYTGDDIYKYIIGSSQRSRPSVNKQLGLG